MTPEQLAASNTEDAHQMALFAWAATQVPMYPMLRWMHAIPNGGNRDARAGARMKATGTRPGVFDICLPVPTMSEAGWLHGLYIEMKRPASRGKAAGRMSAEQKEFNAHLSFFNYHTALCYTWMEARDVILSYLSTLPHPQVASYKDHVR